MITKIDPKITLAILLSKSTTEISIIQGILSLLVAFGFFFFDGRNANYDLLYSFASPIVWTAIFTGHGISKLVSVFTQLPRMVVLLTELIGVWCWTYILLSFTFFDPTPTAPTEILAILPIMLEFWTLLDCPSPKQKGRQND